MSREIIVQKFGGTSLSTAEARKKAAGKVAAALSRGFKTVVVVSAMGRKGDPYATDTFLSLVGDNLPKRERDLLLSCGEIISAAVMVKNLKELGWQAVALTGQQAGIITEGDFGETHISEIRPQRVIEEIKTNRVPVIAGFQGVTPDGEITTLGRGGSDITASILAAKLKAHHLEIYTDVNGLMTADPRVVPDAKTLNKADYEELCELAFQGAKVMHPRAAEIARRKKVPLRICSTFSQDEGTWVGEKEETGELVTGIATKKDIVFVKILPRLQQESASGLKVFRLLGEAGISVDMINVQAPSISFIIGKKDCKDLSSLLDENDYKYNLCNDYCKLTLVGAGMTGVPGVMGKITEALQSEAIPIFQATDSLTSIACLIKERDEARAVRLLHDTFSLEEVK